MSNKDIPLTYKGHPLRRKDSLIYYGSMAEKYIIMLQVLNSRKEQDPGAGHKGGRPAPADRPRSEKPRPRGQKDREGQPVCRYGRSVRVGWIGPYPASEPGPLPMIKKPPQSACGSTFERRDKPMILPAKLLRTALLTTALAAVCTIGRFRRQPGRRYRRGRRAASAGGRPDGGHYSGHRRQGDAV